MKKPKQPTANRTKSAMAAKLGISRSTLYAWREAGAPIDQGEGAVLQWAMNETRKGSDTDDMRAAKLAVLRETERRLRLANDVKARELVSTDEVRQFMSRLAQAYFGGIRRIFAEFPRELEQSTKEHIKTTCDAKFAELTKHFATVEKI